MMGKGQMWTFEAYASLPRHLGIDLVRVCQIYANMYHALHGRVNVYARVCVCVCLHARVHAHIHVHVHAFAFACACACLYTYITRYTIDTSTRVSMFFLFVHVRCTHIHTLTHVRMPAIILGRRSHLGSASFIVAGLFGPWGGGAWRRRTNSWAWHRTLQLNRAQCPPRQLNRAQCPPRIVGSLGAQCYRTDAGSTPALCCCYRTDGACPCSRAPLLTRGPDLLRRPRDPQTCTDLLAPPDRLSRLGQPFPTLLPLAPRCRPLQPQGTRPPPAPSLLALQQGDQISASQANPIVKHPHGLLNANICSS
jgi:hypothetical protein